MSEAKIPESWQTLSKEGEIFYNELAKKYVAKVGTEKPAVLIYNFVKENVAFVNSPEGDKSDASTKETQNTIIEFLSELFKNHGIEEDDVVEIWQEVFWSEIN